MFSQFIIILILASHMDGYALDVSIRNPWFNRDEQGSLSSRIVGGVEAPPGFATHSVALVIGHAITSLVCGASIISKTCVLTAAHCIPFITPGVVPETFRGVAGSEYLNSTECLITFTGVVVHEEWDTWNIKNDIAVLITKPIRLSKLVTVIALNYNRIGGNEECYVAGWGTVGYMEAVSDKKLMLNVSTVEDRECVKWLAKYGPSVPPVDPEKELCTFHSKGYGMCHGDSGSALVHYETGKLVGVVTWARPCADGSPDVHGRGSFYKKWVQEACNFKC